jgi:hypothetical protein
MPTVSTEELWSMIVIGIAPGGNGLGVAVGAAQIVCGVADSSPEAFTETAAESVAESMAESVAPTPLVAPRCVQGSAATAMAATASTIKAAGANFEKSWSSPRRRAPTPRRVCSVPTIRPCSFTGTGASARSR